MNDKNGSAPLEKSDRVGASPVRIMKRLEQNQSMTGEAIEITITQIFGESKPGGVPTLAPVLPVLRSPRTSPNYFPLM